MTRFNIVSQELTLNEYRALAEFRRQVRCLENVAEQRTAQFGINLDSYSLLLAVQGLPEGVRPTIDTLAERMCLSREQTSQLIAYPVLTTVLLRDRYPTTSVRWTGLS